jgi:cytochrome P450
VRRAIAPAFTPRMISALEPSIRSRARHLFAKIRPGEPLDLVREVTRELPIRVISELLGIPDPEVDVDRLQFWSDEMHKMGAVLSPAELDAAAANAGEMGRFLSGLFHRNRAEGDTSNGLMNTLAAAQLDNERLSEANIVMLSIAVLVGGNETTRT